LYVQFMPSIRCKDPKTFPNFIFYKASYKVNIYKEEFWFPISITRIALSSQEIDYYVWKNYWNYLTDSVNYLFYLQLTLPKMIKIGESNNELIVAKF
jgi:hypothetical protein